MSYNPLCPVFLFGAIQIKIDGELGCLDRVVNVFGTRVDLKFRIGDGKRLALSEKLVQFVAALEMLIHHDFCHCFDQYRGSIGSSQQFRSSIGGG